MMRRDHQPVSSHAAMGTPASSRCPASRSSRGPLPARTTGAFLSAESVPPERSRMSAPPAPMTPGSVQPGKGTGRSMPPGAMMMCEAVSSSALPFMVHETRCGSRPQTVAPG